MTKYIPYIIILFCIIFIGVLLYEKIGNDNTVDLLNEHIDTITRDNERLSGQLEFAIGEIATGGNILDEFRKQNNELRKILEGSAQSSGRIRDTENAIREIIDRCEKITGEASGESSRVRAEINECLQIIRNITK